MRNAISKQIREAALGPAKPVDKYRSASLSAWVPPESFAFAEVCDYLDWFSSEGFLSPLPDNNARRLFLLLVAEALDE